MPFLKRIHRGGQLLKLAPSCGSLILAFLIFILFTSPGFISPSFSSQLRFLDRAPGCGLSEAREANRLRKTVLARPITPRQSTLHVIVLGIHA